MKTPVRILLLCLLSFGYITLHAQKNVKVIYNDMWQLNGAFPCVKTFVGAQATFSDCPYTAMLGQTGTMPTCGANLCGYDIVLVQATYTNVDSAFIDSLIKYIQCGGSLYFQNDVTSGNPTAQTQNTNDLLAAIGVAPVTLTPDLSSYTNQPVQIIHNNSAIQCPDTSQNISFISGGFMSGNGLANASTVSISQGTVAAFWPTGYGGILGIGSEHYSSGHHQGTCLSGSGDFIWGFMCKAANSIGGASNAIKVDTAICAGDTLCLSASHGTSYSWSNGDTTQQSCLSTGTFTVAVGDSNGCAHVDTFVVDSGDVPTAAFNIDMTLCPTVQFLNNSVGSSLVYSWDFGDSSSPDTTAAPSHNYFASGNGPYTAILTVSNGCGTDSDTLNFFIDCILSAQQLQMSEVLLYPSPAKDNLTITGIEDAKKVQIFDDLGRRVYLKEVDEGVRMAEQDIDVQDLASGIYLVRIEAADWVVNKSFLKD